MEATEPFGWMVGAEAMKRGFYQAAKKAIVGDGGNWIGPLGDLHFPGWEQPWRRHTDAPANEENPISGDLGFEPRDPSPIKLFATPLHEPFFACPGPRSFIGRNRIKGTETIAPP